MFKRAAIFMFSILLLVNLYGCVGLLVDAAAGGAGTAVWLSNKLVLEVDTPFDKTIDASRTALKSLNLEINKEVIKKRVAQIRGKYPDGRDIWIDIHKLSQSASRLEVRVGGVGQQKAALKILDKITDYLQ